MLHCTKLEHLLKMSLEDLREFLQEKIALSSNMSDDVVIEHLQSSMSELRRMKLDLPPPGTVDILCDVINSSYPNSHLGCLYVETFVGSVQVCTLNRC